MAEVKKKKKKKVKKKVGGNSGVNNLILILFLEHFSIPFEACSQKEKEISN